MVHHACAMHVVHHASDPPCMVLQDSPRFPKIPQDSPFGPLRGAAWRPWPLAPPGPPVFFVVFFVFARPPAGSDYPGRPLNERSNDLSHALHGPWPDSQSKQVDRLSIDGVAARSLAASLARTYSSHSAVFVFGIIGIACAYWPTDCNVPREP